MNNEIKEIELWKEKTKGIFHITEYARFWNYITNLQQKIEQYENPDDMTLFYMWLDIKAKDKIKDLQEDVRTGKEINAELKQENERLKTIKPCMLNFQECYVVKDYKSRCEKAIEYIDNFKKYFLDRQPFVDTRHIDLEHLLNILQNGSDDNEL